MNGKENLDQHQSQTNPVEHGWEIDGKGNVEIKWVTKARAIIQYSKIKNQKRNWTQKWKELRKWGMEL